MFGLPSPRIFRSSSPSVAGQAPDYDLDARIAPRPLWQRLLPKSLFGRLALLMFLVVAILIIAAGLLVRQDRAALLTRQFSDTKLAEVRLLKATLVHTPARHAILNRLSREFGIRLVPERVRDTFGRQQDGTPRPPAVGAAPGSRLPGHEPGVTARESFGEPLRLPTRFVPPGRSELPHTLAERIRNELGADTEIRLQPRPDGAQIWIRLFAADDEPVWAGVYVQRPPEDIPERLLIFVGLLTSVSLVVSYVFARRLNRPLKELASAVSAVGRGQTPPPLAEDGPSEIAQVSRGFNQMAANLRRMEADRTVLLAGVSHDLRTPLARLRLGIEMAAQDEGLKAGMVADIEDMEKIIGQFLSFARGEEDTAEEWSDLPELVQAILSRYRTKTGRDTTTVSYRGLQAGVRLLVRPVAIERMLLNLLENAFAYGSPTVEVTLTIQQNRLRLIVADRGPGIAPDQVERLKRPFTRLDTARGNTQGAGLGLAIVDRIVRLHRGQFDLLPRAGGGTEAAIALPLDNGSSP